MLPSIFLFASAATALRLHGFEPSAINDRFTISRLPRVHSRLHAAPQSSELKVTDHVLKLTRTDAPSLSSIYVKAMLGRSRVARATVSVSNADDDAP
jgi:hypothetical protein